MAPFIRNVFGGKNDEHDIIAESVIERMEKLERRNSELEEAIKIQDKKIEEILKTLNAIKETEGKGNGSKQNDCDNSSVQEMPTGKEHIGKPYHPEGYDTEKEDKAPTTLYFSAPTPSGEFRNASATEQVGTSIYKLVTSDNVNGQFVMIDSKDAICTASISVSQFVKPVCKIVSAYKGMPQRVVNKEEGTAFLERGVWKVTKKAIIEFA